MRHILRRLRGALGNAAIWGAGWFALAYALFAGYTILQPGSAFVFSMGAFYGAVRIATAGALTGVLVSAFIAANFRHQTLQDISAGTFAFGAGLVTVLPIMAISLSGNLTAGWPFFLRDAMELVLLYGSIGTITGYGTIKLAKRGLPPAAGTPELEAGGDALPPEA